MSTQNGIEMDIVSGLMNRERERFIADNPASEQLSSEAKRNLFGGVPMHWMADWSTPFPIFVKEARGARFRDADGRERLDFCLGDTGTMFGHAPEPIAKAMQAQSTRGYTTMLPSPDAAWLGIELKRRFGLDFWQVTSTATDANRDVIRWARAATGRPIILVHDGCYHGSLDDALVRSKNGVTAQRAGLIGQVRDNTRFTRVVDFNDVAALEAALKPGDVAALLCEPALTNTGMVLPDEGYHQAVRALTRQYGTLLIIDETHTISTGPGGYTRAFDLEPDMFVLGKPIAGGIPSAVYGATKTVARRMEEAQARARHGASHGHSGMGTTLSANAFQLACMRACLSEVMTEAAYEYMIPLAEKLATGLRQLFHTLALPWSVTQIGSRCEFQFTATPPRNAREAEAAFNIPLENYIHLYLINRGVMITPFHNMMLVCPATTEADVAKLVATVEACARELLGARP